MSPHVDNYAGQTVGVVEPRTMRLDLPQEGFALEQGGVLKQIDVTYEICGKITPDFSNVIYICHALTGDAHVAGIRPGNDHPDGWWEKMVGGGRGIDTNYYCVICSNILTGCMGTTGPSSINPDTGKPYGSAFPAVSVADMVNVQYMFLRQLGVRHLVAVAGGSFGGMQVLDWAIRYAGFIDRAVVIAAAASLNAQALAFDIIGRRAITEDSRWKLGNYYESLRKPTLGLGQARRLAHITYLSETSMSDKFGRARRREWLEREGLAKLKASLRFRTAFEVESYLDYQARKFIGRFDANSYLHITRAMDEFDLEEQYGSLDKAFEAIRTPMLIVSLSGDWLFTPEQSSDMARALLTLRKPVSYFHLQAPAGHDAFLTHTAELAPAIHAFLPWVGTPVPDIEEPLEERQRTAYRHIAAHIAPGSRVLDLGCGTGCLLRLLRREKGVEGTGLEIDLDSARETLDGGDDILLLGQDGSLRNADGGCLSLIPDNSFDTVILSDTLQVLQKPHEILTAALRIARHAVVAFPNFGYLPTRLRLLLTGRMPKNRGLPYEWYDTPNIHLFTYRDFVDLCRNEGIVIQHVTHMAGSLGGRLLIACGLANAGAERVIADIGGGERQPKETTDADMD